MARDGTSRILATIPDKYAPDFAERLDKRTSIARAILGRIESIETDLGGADTLSHARRSLVRRVVWLEAIVEHSEQKLAAGEAIDLGAHTGAINTLLGLFRLLGLDRKARPAMGLHEFMAAKSAAAAPGGDQPQAAPAGAPDGNSAGIAPESVGGPESPPFAEPEPAAPEHSA